jgi:hypothetical protein
MNLKTPYILSYIGNSAVDVDEKCEPLFFTPFPAKTSAGKIEVGFRS